jgi:biotin carboxyl carrier protein
MMIEAMKMEHPIRSPHTGTVTAIDVRLDDQVDSGTTLLVVTGDADGAE